MALSDEATPEVSSQDLPKASPLNENFKKLVSETLEKWHIQGISVAVVDGDDTWAEVNTLLDPPRITADAVVGIWNCSVARCSSATVNSVLHWQHDKGLHSSCSLFASGRRGKVSQYQVENPS